MGEKEPKPPKRPTDNSSGVGSQDFTAAYTPRPSNWASGLLSTLTNVFRNPFPAMGKAIMGSVPPPASPFYQVKQTDTSLGAVAQAVNVPLSTLSAANNGVKSLPPAGSYIMTAGQGRDALPPSPGAGYQSGPPNRTQKSATTDPFAVPSEMTTAIMQEIRQINLYKSLNMGINQLSYGAAALYGYRPEDMQAAGYTAEAGKWVYSGGSSPDLGPNPGGGWIKNPKTGNWRPYRGWHGGGRGKRPGPADNANLSPQTVLSLRLASG